MNRRRFFAACAGAAIAPKLPPTPQAGIPIRLIRSFNFHPVAFRLTWSMADFEQTYAAPAVRALADQIDRHAAEFVRGTRA